MTLFSFRDAHGLVLDGPSWVAPTPTETRTCESCRFFVRDGTMRECHNVKLIQFDRENDQHVFAPPPAYGCTFHQAKTGPVRP